MYRCCSFCLTVHAWFEPRLYLYVYHRTYNFLLAPVDWEGGGVFAREFVVTINARQETLDLDVHYRGSSLGEPTNC